MLSKSLCLFSKPSIDDLTHAQVQEEIQQIKNKYFVEPTKTLNIEIINLNKLLKSKIAQRNSDMKVNNKHEIIVDSLTPSEQKLVDSILTIRNQVDAKIKEGLMQLKKDSLVERYAALQKLDTYLKTYSIESKNNGTYKPPIL